MLPMSARLARIWSAIALAILVLSSAGTARTGTPYQILAKKSNPILWQGFDGWAIITEDLTEGRKCYSLNFAYKTTSTLIEEMPTTAAPLGSQIKWLMYMDHYQGLDRLMAGDVDNDVSHIAMLSNRNQLGCGMRGNVCIFGQYTDRDVGGHYAVDLYSIDLENGGALTSFLVSDSEKTQFAHDGNLMVYRACYSATDIRICGIRFDGGDELTIANRNGFEPSVCGSIVAWYETNGAGYNIIATNLDTGEIRTIAYTTANPPRPEAGRGSVFWEDKRSSTTTGVDIYGYDWQTGQVFAVTTASGDQLKLRVCDSLVTWTTGTTSQTLWGASVLPPVKVSDLSPIVVDPASVTLGWTSVGDSISPPTAYDLRMRTDGPIDDANWASSAPVSGMPVPRAIGQTESFQVSPLNTGLHYFAIKVRLQNGEWSSLSNCVCAYVSEETTALHDAPEGTCISFTGVVNGVGSGNTFYCQRGSRTQAVRVIPETAQSVSVGQRVTVTGSLAQDDDLRGPVLKNAIVLLDAGTEAVRPLGMRPVSLGGFDARYGGTTEGGPSNLWVRVRLWGKVSYLTTTSGCSFYVSDGSKLQDNSGRGIYITSRFPAPTGLTDGKYVSVEGICRVSKTNNRQIEIVESAGIKVL